MTGADKAVRWQRMTPEDVWAAAEAQAVVIQPMGSIELHGAPTGEHRFCKQRGDRTAKVRDRRLSRC